MRITRVEAWPVPLRLGEPYTIGYGSYESVTVVFLRLETDEGLIGLGAGSPDEEVTGECWEGVLGDLKTIAEPRLHGGDPLPVTRLLGDLAKALSGRPTALATVDQALHDLWGKKEKLPLWKLLGGKRDRMPTSVTIGILPLDETLDRARRWQARGFTRLKIKGGHDVALDIERVRKIRETVGPHQGLCFDANQAYGVAEALRLARETEGAGLEFMEQPTPKRDRAALQAISAASSLPVMADESLLTLEDARDLIDHECAALFNLKLMKVGGIDEARRIATLATEARRGLMVGCMDESALSISAGLQFALSHPGVRYADLDGHLDLIGDPASGSIGLEGGALVAPSGPGLGVNVWDGGSG